MLTFDQLVSRQTKLAQSIANAPTNMKKFGVNNYTHANLSTRHSLVERSWKEFTENHLQLIGLRDEKTEGEDYFKKNQYSTTEEVYMSAISYLLGCLEALPPPAVPPAGPAGPVNVATTIRHLPRIQIPTFSGDFINWANFRDLFMFIVNTNQSLTNVERLHYLKMNVTGEASQLLSSLLTVGENFDRAWTLLTSRYENRRLLVSAHLHALTSLKHIANESAAELKRLINGTITSRGALEQLQRPVNHWDDLLVHITVGKLDPATRREWETQIGADDQYPTFERLKVFLTIRINMLEALHGPDKSKRANKNNEKKSESASSSHHVSTARKTKCVLCTSDHFIMKCPDFSAKTPEQRRAIVSSKKLCYKCLGNHLIADCRNANRCRRCKGHHRSMLCATPNTESPSASGTESTSHHASTATPSSSQKMKFNGFTTHTSRSSTSPVILATALVHVYDDKDQPHIARALLDQGSESSFATDALVKRLNLKRTPTLVPIHGIGGSQAAASQGRTTLKLSSRYHAKEIHYVNTLILPYLSNYQPHDRIRQHDWTHLNGLHLAEDYSQHTGPIEIILGADVYTDILCEGMKRGPKGTPLAQHTAFGWVLSGCIKCTNAQNPDTRTSSNTHHAYVLHQHRSTDQSRLQRAASRQRTSTPLSRHTDEAGGMFAPQRSFHGTHCPLDQPGSRGTNWHAREGPQSTRF